MSYKVTVEAGQINMRVRFTLGDRPAGDGLLPNQCSWGNRPMRSGEPFELCVLMNKIQLIYGPDENKAVVYGIYPVEFQFLHDLADERQTKTLPVTREFNCYRVKEPSNPTPRPPLADRPIKSTPPMPSVMPR